MYNQKRYEQLDSLRGCAALSVLAFHYVTRFNISKKFAFITQRTPLRLFCAGHEPVILFFVLSGFVLSLPYLSKRSVPYHNYVLKRVFRIYAAYFVMLVFAVPLRGLLYSGGISGLSENFNNGWLPPADDTEAVLAHMLLIGEFDAIHYNGVVWTLTHEMRISLLFPFLM